MKNLIYVTNANVSPAIGSPVQLGGIARKCGKNIIMSGDTITITKPGYYDVAVSATGTSAAGGTVGLRMQADGIDIHGAVAEESVEAGSIANISFGPIVRAFCCKPVTLKLISSGNAATTFSNLAVKVVEV